MSLYGSFSLDAPFAELSVPYDSQRGVRTPAQRRAEALSNLYGSAYVGDVLNSPNLANAAITDRFTQVPNVVSGGVLATHTTQVMTHSIRIKSVDGTLYYIMVTNAATNRTGGA
jgi:hypothetical protein